MQEQIPFDVWGSSMSVGQEEKEARGGFQFKPSLYVGDSLEILPRITDGSMRAVITDPPYILGSASARKSANKAIGWADINNAAKWYAMWFSEVWRTMVKNAPLWVFGNWRSFPVYQCAASKVPGMSIVSVVVWDKEWPSVGSLRGLRQNYELIILFAKPDFAISSRSIGDIWKCKWTSHKPNGHPQEKPVQIIKRMIEVSGIEGGTILDPFMGSGSTGIAALESKCGFIGIEIEEMHYKTAEERLLSEGRTVTSS